MLVKLRTIVALAAAFAAVPEAAGAGTRTFIPTGGEQEFVVPGGVRSLQVVAIGGQGAVDSTAFARGGFGARVSAQMSVTPGQRLYVVVGGNGEGSRGGFNGGGDGGATCARGGGGGGASDVRTLPLAAAG